MGGPYMRLYADRYRQDVVGLVLVDSAHPDQFRRQAAVLPPESPDDSESLRFYRDWFTNAPEDPTLNPALFEAGSLGDMPLVVLTAPNKERADDFPTELNAKFNEIWLELQKELVQLSSNSTQVISDKSQHFIQRDQPMLVIDAIRQVVSAAPNPPPPTLTHALSPEPTALPYDVVRDLPFVADRNLAQILTIHLPDEENRGKPALWLQGGKKWQQPVVVDLSVRHRCASRTCRQGEMP
jgi:pimeloyl-ACP methyl ester carboxylesterase